jgi:hypothetical protein
MLASEVGIFLSQHVCCLIECGLHRLSVGDLSRLREVWSLSGETRYGAAAICYTRGMTNDKIRALISRWRQRVDAQEHALKTVDRMEDTGVDLPETSGLLTQAHQDELERCIMELEQLFE